MKITFGQSLNLALATSLFLVTIVVDASSSNVAPDFMLRSLATTSSYSYMKFEQCVELEVDVSQDEDESMNVTRTLKESIPYVAYKMCSDCSLKKCSDSTFLAPLGEALGSMMSFTDQHCTSCTYECEQHKQQDYDEANATDVSGDCTVCMADCTAIEEGHASGNYTVDETQAMWCTTAYRDDVSGMQYYSRATCGSDGHLMIGLFTDGDCTIEVNSNYGKKFTYNTFNAMESFCMDCADNECYAEESMSLECVKGVNTNEDLVDDMGVCEAYQKATSKWINSLTGAAGSHQYLVIFLGVLIAAALSFVGYKHIVQYMEERETERLIAGGLFEGKKNENAQLA